MDKETRKALEGSIRKWAEIVAGTGADCGVENCPLCQMFNNEDSERICVGCPVYDAVGNDGCDDTPYVDWCKVATGEFPRFADTDEKRAAAREELKFLRSLRS